MEGIIEALFFVKVRGGYHLFITAFSNRVFVAVF